MTIRYVKRFTGTKKNPSHIIVLQQWIEGLGWSDVTPERARWETPEDEKRNEEAVDYRYLREPR